MTAHKNVYTALAAAQSEFSAPKKDAVNPAFRSKYADLASVVEAVAPALSRHGIAFLHMTVGDGDAMMMRTALFHGESDTSTHCDVPLILGKRDMQGFKSATTYAKRIGLESVTGVAPEDDDGNGAASSAPKSSRTPPPVKPGPRAEQVDDRFETPDGAVGVRGAGPLIGTPAERARQAADDLMARFKTAKTLRGLDGMWQDSANVITRLMQSYPAEHGDVLAFYEVRAKQLGDDEMAVAGHP